MDPTLLRKRILGIRLGKKPDRLAPSTYGNVTVLIRVSAQGHVIRRVERERRRHVSHEESAVCEKLKELLVRHVPGESTQQHSRAAPMRSQMERSELNA